MYTVLIQPNKTLESFQRFSPFFADAVEQERIGICGWTVEGETTEIALPDLYDLVGGKKAWRAIVVCPELNEKNSDHPSESLNPFDFLENADRQGITVEDGCLVDSKVPLIHLTHLLGGMPTPEPKFEAVSVFDKRCKTSRIVYRPSNEEELEEQKQAIEAWENDHALEAFPPTEILLLSLRDARTALVKSGLSWEGYTESNSSLFWKRNLYPSNCRFLVYDINRGGGLQREEDLFKLWIAVALLAENYIDSDTLQARRLYHLDIMLDQPELKHCFQATVDQLNGARYQLEKSIQKDEYESQEGRNEIPDYQIDVPVSFQSEAKNELSPIPEIFSLTGGIESTDMQEWKQYCDKTNHMLRHMLHNIDRELDRASCHVQQYCQYADSEIYYLSKHQKEDLELELRDLYSEMMDEQARLPANHSDVQDEMNRAEKNVRQMIVQRVTAKQAVGTGGLAAAAVMVSFASSFLHGAQPRFVLLPLLFVCMLAFAELCVLMIQRSLLVEAARRFERLFLLATSELNKSADAFSQFLSSAASHMRGQIFLNKMNWKREQHSSSYYVKQQHLKKIESLLARLSVWDAALHTNIDLDSMNAMDFYGEDMKEIDYDTLYKLSSRKKSKVMLNRTGLYLDTAFPFVKHLEIEREEIYDGGEHV